MSSLQSHLFMQVRGNMNERLLRSGSRRSYKQKRRTRNGYRPSAHDLTVYDDLFTVQVGGRELWTYFHRVLRKICASTG